MPSVALADRLIAAGYVGMRVQSFATGAATDALKVTSKNALRGIFRDGNGKMRFSVSFIFKHLRA